MDEKILVSIIVPVYNVINYLDRCVSSICQQSYKDIEILLVDDGSTDASGKRCDELAKEDERITVFHKPNGGLSDARNFAMDRAKGAYLTFIDSDDYIGTDYVKALVELADKYDVRMSVVGMIPTYSEDKEFAASDNISVEKLSFEEAFGRMCCWDGFGVTACAKLYHKSLFEEIRFPAGKLYEDLDTIPWVLEKCDSIAMSSENLYYYYQRPGSIVNGRVTLRNFTMIDTMRRLVDHFGKRYPRLKEYAELRAIRGTLTTLAEPALDQDDYYELMTVYRDSFSDILERAQTNPYLSKMRKLQAKLILNNLSLHRTVFRTIKKARRRRLEKESSSKLNNEPLQQ